jgi:hypothetical protein
MIDLEDHARTKSTELQHDRRYARLRSAIAAMTDAAVGPNSRAR